MYIYISCQGVRCEELLNEFIFFPSIGRFTRTSNCSFNFRVVLLGVSCLITQSLELCRMGKVLTKNTLTLKLVKNVRHSIVRVYLVMTYIVIEICTIYIILIDLPY